MKPLQVLPTIQLGTFIFLICCYFIVTIKVKQRSDFLIWFSPRPLLPWQFQVEWPVNSLAYWRTEPPVFSIILKMQSKPLRINHMWKERRMAWEKERKSILNCINILTSKWIQANSSLVVTLIYEQLGIHINIVPLCLPLLNQGGLTRKVPSLKPENRLFLIAFHSFTYAFIPHMFSEYLSCAMH